MSIALLVLAPAATAGTRIVGGHQTNDGDFPWQVALVDTHADNPIDGFFCGGTLIAPTLVLTAAHCAAGATPDDIEVIANRRVLSDTGSGSVIAVEGISINPDSLAPGGVPRHDLSILVLESAVPSAAPLPIAALEGGADDGLYAPGVDLTVTGWGMLHDPDEVGGAFLPDSLHTTTVTRRSDLACSETYGAQFDAVDMLCAGGAATDTCYGDSGGGLVAPTGASPDPAAPADWKLVGIVSWGQGCASPTFPGVYVRVTAAALHAYATQPDPVVAPLVASQSTVAGIARVGQVLTCTPGTFTGPVTTSEIRWVHVFDFGIEDPFTAPIEGATATTYAPVDADVGSRIGCETTAVNGGGSAIARPANSVGPVTNAGGLVPVNPLTDALNRLNAANAALAQARAQAEALAGQARVQAAAYAQAQADLATAKQEVARLTKAAKKAAKKAKAKKAKAKKKKAKAKKKKAKTATARARVAKG